MGGAARKVVIPASAKGVADGVDYRSAVENTSRRARTSAIERLGERRPRNATPVGDDRQQHGSARNAPCRAVVRATTAPRLPDAEDCASIRCGCPASIGNIADIDLPHAVSQQRSRSRHPRNAGAPRLGPIAHFT
ncbi:hypothetical protein [Burkholderia territorii]|uniref:hypothetical protein n=1 Tax=Burkholderia territorii TaxID=1503055 RepID=UPI0012DA65C3|nr:hypothetical protein [Burkholderia territorii]